jgi:hypothetical protein
MLETAAEILKANYGENGMVTVLSDDEVRKIEGDEVESLGLVKSPNNGKEDCAVFTTKDGGFDENISVPIIG